MMLEFEYTTNTTEKTVPGFKVRRATTHAHACALCVCV